MPDINPGTEIYDRLNV